MRVLVTGATGFIGQYVIENLLQKGCDIIATSSNREKAKSCNWYDRVIFEEFSIEQSVEGKNLFRFFKEPDIVIHLAWQGLPNYNELFHIQKNLFSQFNFLTNLIENGLKDILITGTCLEYGMLNGQLKETMETHPSNPYALAKDSLRKFLEMVQSKYQFSIKWVRLFYMYGVGQSMQSIIPLLEKAEYEGEKNFKMSGGEQLRDYMHVKEVAAGVSQIALQNKVQGIINCCSGKPISVKRFVEEYIFNNNFKIKPQYGFYPYPYYEPMAFWGDDAKLKTICKQDKFSFRDESGKQLPKLKT